MERSDSFLYRIQIIELYDTSMTQICDIKPENKRADKQPVEKYSAAQKPALKQIEPGQGAKDLLNKMQNKYDYMDFFVADYSSDDEAQRYLSRGGKEYSVLIVPELLEKMAVDDSVKKSILAL